MYRNAFVPPGGKPMTLMYAIGSKPLRLWSCQVTDGALVRVTDEDIKSSVIELSGPNPSTALITAPSDPGTTLGIKLPVFIILCKNMVENSQFSIEFDVLDNKGYHRRIRACTYTSRTRQKQGLLASTTLGTKKAAIDPQAVYTLPLKLDQGWNSVAINLGQLTKQCFGTDYLETQRVTVKGSRCRLRRIFYTDKVYSEEELPREYRIYVENE